MKTERSGFLTRKFLTGHVLYRFESFFRKVHLFGIELKHVLKKGLFQIDVFVFAFDRELQMVSQGDRLGRRIGDVQSVGYVIDDIDGGVDDHRRDVADDAVIGILDVVEGAVDPVQRSVLIRPVKADALAKSDDFSSLGDSSEIWEDESMAIW